MDFRPNKEVVGIDNKRKVVIVKGGEEILTISAYLRQVPVPLFHPYPGGNWEV